MFCDSSTAVSDSSLKTLFGLGSSHRMGGASGIKRDYRVGGSLMVGENYRFQSCYRVVDGHEVENAYAVEHVSDLGRDYEFGDFQ